MKTRPQYVEVGSGGPQAYVVDLARGRLGRLLRVVAGDAAPDDGLCYQQLRGRDRPCVGCPWLDRGVRGDVELALVDVGAGASDQRATVCNRVVGGRMRESSVEIVSLSASESAIARLCASRLDQLATRHGLSVKERAVLELLVLGRTQAEAGEALGIAPRTVKFHQSNLLAKLGAESRTDLLRVLLHAPDEASAE